MARLPTTAEFAEMERRARAEPFSLAGQLIAQVHALTAERDAAIAEVARLREAGDAVLSSFGPDDERWFSDEMRDALNKLAVLVLPDDEEAARALVEPPR